MKGRTKFFNYFIACIATLSLATFAACSDDDPETPSGKLVLTASASSFVAGEGNVTFMVTYDGEDVTSQAAITNVTTGEPVENAAWTTTEIGEYKFQAVYDSYTSDPVTVSAIDKKQRQRQRVLSLRTAAQVYVYDVRELCYGTRIFRCAG